MFNLTFGRKIIIVQIKFKTMFTPQRSGFFGLALKLYGSRAFLYGLGLVLRTALDHTKPLSTHTV